MGDDVIHVIQTIFPIPCSELFLRFGTQEETCALSAREAAMEGINMIFALMVDISRDPRWGQVAEGAGEDPIWEAKWRGRGQGIPEKRLGGYAEKPPPPALCFYGAPQGGRDYDGADISERSPGRSTCHPSTRRLKAGVMSVMSSFNDLSGIPVSGNERAIRGS